MHRIMFSSNLSARRRPDRVKFLRRSSNVYGPDQSGRVIRANVLVVFVLKNQGRNNGPRYRRLGTPMKTFAVRSEWKVIKSLVFVF